VAEVELLIAWMFACSGETVEPTPATITVDVPAPTTELPAPPPGTWPTLLISQAQFAMQGTRAVPGPARLVLLSTDGTAWYERVIEDPESNVFHKAIAWRDGILTIAGMGARLVHWKADATGKFVPTVLWQKSWGGKFDRLRDLEVGDVDGDGKEDLVLATHDQGVVAVGRENADGTWTFQELDQTPDTFVHEIELGDVDGDGKLEFYATPSGRNRASGESQPGGVARYAWNATSGAFDRTMVASWAESHAKEILVADVDGDGHHELYAVREAHTEKGADGAPVIKDPVRIVRLTPAPDGTWTQTVAATLQDRQCRFLLPADVDGDSKKELVAAAWKTGLYVLRPGVDGTFTSTLIDADSTGFEHASWVADLDGNGAAELYVAADEQASVRRYTWNGAAFDRADIAPIPAKQRISWNIQDGRF
jgi:hypothetical protein